MRLEISGGPLGVKFGLQGHLGVGKGEKTPLGQNCPKADATIKRSQSFNGEFLTYAAPTCGDISIGRIFSKILNTSNESR